MGARHDRELVDEIARELIENEKLALVPSRESRWPDLIIGYGDKISIGFDGASLSTIRSHSWRKAEVKVKRLHSETLGRIVSVAPAHDESRRDTDGTTLYEVHGDAYLDKFASGRSLLVKIATTVVIARMWDILENGLYERMNAQIAAEASD